MASPPFTAHLQMTQSDPSTQRRSNLPFRGMPASAWQNLALVGIACLYLVMVVLEISWRDTCGRLGADFCSFWSAGYVANHGGYASIYDLGQLEAVQRQIFPATADPSAFVTIPTPYFPIFILPFQLFALFDPLHGYWVWALLNLVGFLLYLRFFTRRTTGHPLPARLLAIALLSWPVFLNFFSGQSNVILAISIGEFLRAAMSGKPFRAGLWLGLLLIKPQFLVLFGLVLLLQRAVRILAGLATTSIVIMVSSALLLRTEGMLRLFQLWTTYAAGRQETLAVGVMMNWRMIALRMTILTGPTIAWAVAIAGLALTLAASLYTWRRPVDPRSPLFAIATLGTLAATGLLAWHSHYTSAIFMLPPLLYLSHPEERLPRHALLGWAFLPTLLYLSSWILAPLLGWLFPSGTHGLPTFLSSGIFLSALGIFGLNIYFLAWSVGKSRFPPLPATVPEA